MNRYELSQIIQMWERDKLTTEQAIGQILLHIQALSRRVGELERWQEEQRPRRSTKLDGS